MVARCSKLWPSRDADFAVNLSRLLPQFPIGATPLGALCRLYAEESINFNGLTEKMKKIIAVLLVAGVCACKKKEETTIPLVPTPEGPLSRFTITFNGKTYKEVEDGIHPVRLDTVFRGKNPGTGVMEYQLQFYWETRNLLITIGGQKSDSSSPLGTYTTTLSGDALPIPVRTANTITIFGDTTRPYIGDAASTVTITSFTEKELKGTLNFTLRNGGNSYPATGDFEFHK